MSAKRWDIEFDEDQNYVNVENPDAPYVLYTAYAKLERKVKRLEKRLLEKKKFETEDLIQRGATPAFIAHIDEKDQKALSD